QEDGPMHAPRWSLVILLLVMPALSAQEPPVRPVAPPGQAPPAASDPRAGTPPLNVPADPQLATMLQQWEQRMKDIRAIEATVTRSETDPVTNTTEVFEGRARFLRPDRADLHLV